MVCLAPQINYEFRIMNFFDKREQCQTRLSNAERRKNAHSELGVPHRILHNKNSRAATV